MNMLSTKVAFGNSEEWLAYQGIILDKGFDRYLSERVRKRFYDLEGSALLFNEFGDIASTELEDKLIKDIFSVSPPISGWRIGEALAECYLEDFEKAIFCYHSSRDMKNPKSSPQGADLVGFVNVNKEANMFLFGEVKTSGDEKSPPQVMYDLKEQICDIKDKPDLRANLVRWLAFKVKDLPEFREAYEEALKLYMKEEEKYRYFIFGVLVRGTKPKDTDLKTKYEDIKKGSSNGTKLKLIALYIPQKIENMENHIR